MPDAFSPLPDPRPTRGGRKYPAGFCVAILLALATLTLHGCASPGYYLQAARGQFELWRLARPVAEVQADPGVAASIQAKLGAATRIRDFASRELALPDNGSFRKYAALDRPYVVWNVFAAREFSVHPREWCFPVAGCVSYRGYFAKADAEDYAHSLRRDGYEVHLGAVPAYSTLGWFDDPLLSTFIDYSETEVARIVFHELAHQVLYAHDDTEFNESFAVAVEQEGLRRWLTRANDPEKRAVFENSQRRRAAFRRFVREARNRLEALYDSPLALEDKRREKALLLAAMRRDYEALKAGPLRGFAAYEDVFGADINNATLASVGLYTQLVPAFEALLARNNHELPRFYAEVKKLLPLTKEERRERLGQEHAEQR